ncbi:structural protein [Leptothoe spongobia]|uniref:Phage protein n=1 Tax=Leptothoe spongobia TAU-MAC 1115 TaxID=1967444 RepID=A0A947DFT9_9CYAN|nr:phage head morphogenesis protein [Leptothoe spongobia]MBT9316312.1 hypothetical protein [Leptothoe spongobia TAU-MAC 1115]
MAWSPSSPDDFSQFEPTDMLDFLDWFERNYTESLAIHIADSFIEGVSVPYAEAIARGEDADVPDWIETLFRYRLAAQWTYQRGYPVAQGLSRNLASVLSDELLEGYMSNYRISPKDVADIPPGIRQAFVESAKFSMDWIKNLSAEAREMIGDLISVDTLKNRTPAVAVPLIEKVLQRELVARELGLVPDDISPDQVSEWASQAQAKVINAISFRAQMISRTESMRAMNIGAMAALQQDGHSHVYVMPHAGSCPHCRRLLDGRVFDIRVLQANVFANFGKRPKDWVAALPQHPQCRHSVGTVPIKYRKAVSELGRLPLDGVVLEFYGLPGGEAAMRSLKLPVTDWLSA